MGNNCGERRLRQSVISTRYLKKVEFTLFEKLSAVAENMTDHQKNRAFLYYPISCNQSQTC